LTYESTANTVTRSTVQQPPEQSSRYKALSSNTLRTIIRTATDKRRYRSEGGPDASRPPDLNKPENIRESSQEHHHNRFLKNAFEPISRVQSVNSPYEFQTKAKSATTNTVLNKQHQTKNNKPDNGKQAIRRNLKPNPLQ